MNSKGNKQSNDIATAFQATLVSSDNGFDDYDIKGHPVAERITVGHGIQRGGICNVYCKGGIKIGVAWKGGILASLEESEHLQSLMRSNTMQTVMHSIQGIQMAWDNVHGGEHRRLLDAVSDAERLVAEARETLQQRETRLAKRKDALRAARTRFAPPGKIEGVLMPLMEALKPYFPGLEPEIYGPFGLGCRFSLGWKKQDEEAQTSGPCLTVEVDELDVCYVDYSRNLHRYSANSIGDRNGLNYEAVKIPATMALADVAALFSTVD